VPVSTTSPSLVAMTGAPSLAKMPICRRLGSDSCTLAAFAPGFTFAVASRSDRSSAYWDLA
jgi:hypothetical protein